LQTLPISPSDQAASEHFDATQFLGLAPFLRMSIAGDECTDIAQELVTRAQQNPDDAVLWMNLSTVMLCLQRTELGLTIQNQALAMQQVYTLNAAQRPAKLRLLMLMVPGTLSANVPLDCLLENSDIELIYYYITPEAPFEAPIPEHDLLMVGISATTENLFLLQQLESITRQWPVPVINAPQHIPNSERHTASTLLQDQPGLTIAQAHPVTFSALSAVAEGNISLSSALPGSDFPVILRPAGSHGGHGLEKVISPEELASYLTRVQVEDYFLSQFIDYSNADGQFRKYRISLIDGVPYACHMAISSHWMVHYVNAFMYEDQKKREEEAAFLNNFHEFVARHQQALKAIYDTTQLDYLGIDCSETPDGSLLVFEIDPAMVVHAMDLEVMFPHKQIHMNKVKTACRELLLSRAFAHSGASADAPEGKEQS
jgi:glutathione synthase/RimK-type ligase-like ATP-grasp enzyme